MKTSGNNENEQRGAALVDKVYEEKYVLHLSAKNLITNERRSAINTMALMYLRNLPVTTMEKVGATEIVRSSCNPEWVTSLVVDYQFQKVQEVVVKVYNVPETLISLDEDKLELIGEATFKLPSLIYSAEQGLSLSLQHPTNSSPGTVEVRGESLFETREMVLANFSGKGFSLGSGFFTSPEIFLTISRQNENSSWTMVWRGEKVSVSSNPEEAVNLGDLRLSLSSLCNGDKKRPLKLSIWIYSGQGKHEAKGSAITSTEQLLEAKDSLVDLFQELESKGQVRVQECRMESGATFTQYLQGGCEISLLVAIDFTYSNGAPYQSNSLHHIEPSSSAKKRGLNPYQQAISSVGSILQAYDSDNLYSVYGFGAELPGSRLASHCFNLHPRKAEVKGVQGILELYESVVPSLKFASPTNFAEIIEEASSIAARANCSQESQKYFILLLLTDGVLHDLEATIEAIVKASEQPLSIVIVGISRESDGETFERMKLLDSDDKLLQHGDLVARRDIVQFVPFRDFFGRGMEVLAEEVLAEIPEQLVGFMEERGIMPNTGARSVPQGK